MLFDAHAHLDDARFDEDRDEVIAALKQNGVSLVVNAGSDIPSSEATLSLAEKWPCIYAAVGVHPHEAKTYGTEAEARLREMAKSPRVRAIGEIGLDYHYDLSERGVQRDVFAAELQLADSLGLPYVVHTRDAMADTIDVLKSNLPKTRGLIHCYSGSTETLKLLLDMGMVISLGGTVTFKNARKAVEAAKYVPGDCLLLETDCPYLAPVPMRGERNEPAFMKYTAAKIAEIRETDYESLCRAAYENALHFYGIKDA